MQWRGVRRLSVCLSVCKLLRKSLLLAGKWPDRQVSLHPGCAQGLKVMVNVKGHVMCALSWILGMNYSVIDGLVSFF